jgi:hypothetical protein
MTTHRSPQSLRRALIGAILALTVFLLPSAAAQADYEEAAEQFGNGDLVFGTLATDVNVDGTGGVEPGSLYVGVERGRVLRFTSGTEGEAPKFREAWGWGIAVGGPANEYVKCGPAYAEIPEGSRPPHTFAECKASTGGNDFGEEVGHIGLVIGLAVNQATGHVYVRNSSQKNRQEHHLIQVFTATGTPVGEGFGDYARVNPFPSESIAEGPAKLHEDSPRYEQGLAVSEDGTVFVTDHDFAEAPGVHEARIMAFKPENPGDYAHYVYAGRASDIVASSFAQTFVRVAVVGANRLVTASKQQIREYATTASSAPICTYDLTSGEVRGLAANTETGEVYFARQAARTRISRFGPCNPSTGKFEELQAPISTTPPAEEIYALAVNPSLAWSPQRPKGVLYAVNPQFGPFNDETGIGHIFVPAVVGPPAVQAQSVANTTSTSTTLQARVDPGGLPVEFQFEYLSEAEYQDNGESFEGPHAPRAAPISPGRLGGGGIGIATAPLSNLSPDSEYVFRVVARRHGCGGEPSCEVVGSIARFSTYPATGSGLPDDRLYELVSPADKNGGEAFPADQDQGSCLGECKPPGGQIYSVFPMQSAPSGDAVSYMGYPFSPTEGAPVLNSYVSRRTAAGWQTTAMSPRRSYIHYEDAYAESLGQGAITTEAGTALADEAPSGYQNVYLQDSGDPGDLQPVLTEDLFEALSGSGRPYRGPGLLQVRYGGHSPDFSRQFFQANDSFTDAGPYAPEPPDPGPIGRDLYEWREGELALVNVLPGNAALADKPSFASASPDANGIAANGRRVFWTAGGHLYMREDGRTTREVHHGGNFITASPDGLEVLLSDGCLYSLAGADCSADLTQGKGGFLGIAGQSDDLSRIYFVAKAKLPGENERHQEAVAGQPNLYLYEDGGPIEFIGTLVPFDGQGEVETLNTWAVAPGERTAEASPDGRYLAFASAAPLTDYDNVGPCKRNSNHTAYEARPCSEVMLYDSATSQLTCPSCNPTGEAPLGSSTLRRIKGAGNRPWMPQPRYLTDQGRLFFDSSDRLSPRDSNGRVEDVYEAEPEGVGSCGRPGGCVSLVSPGTGSVDSNFLAMDASGANAFFTSRERLVPADTDELIDVYDARVGGGFATDGETPGSGCQGEACQPITNPLTVPRPASSSFQGSGNVRPEKPKRCPKGKVKRKGKCIKKHGKRNHGGAK